MSSPSVSIPKKSAEEKARDQAEADALQKQTEILERQQALVEQQLATQNLLSPFLYEDLGITPQFNEEGEIVGFDREPDPGAELREEIEQGLLERSAAALRGELPVNPALLSDLSEQEEQLRETLLRQLGPGFETSTPGIEALAEFNQRRNELLEAARRGDLTLGEQLSHARTGAEDIRLRNLFGNMAFAAGFPFAPGQQLGGIAQGFGSNAAGFGASANRFQQNRSLILQAQLANASQPGVLGQILGGIAGPIVGGFGAGFGEPFGTATFGTLKNIFS